MNQCLTRIVVLTLALTPMACGSGDSGGSGSNSGGDKLDPCKLVSKAEAEQILGASISQPRYEQNVSTVRACVYEPDDPYGEVRVALFDLPSNITPEDQYETGFDSAQPVTGLGDKARCNDNPPISTLMVLAKKRVLQVVAKTCTTAIAFGKLAVPRL